MRRSRVNASGLVLRNTGAPEVRNGRGPARERAPWRRASGRRASSRDRACPVCGQSFGTPPRKPSWPRPSPSAVRRKPSGGVRAVHPARACRPGVGLRCTDPILGGDHPGRGCWNSQCGHSTAGVPPRHLSSKVPRSSPLAASQRQCGTAPQPTQVQERAAPRKGPLRLSPQTSGRRPAPRRGRRRCRS